MLKLYIAAGVLAAAVALSAGLTYRYMDAQLKLVTSQRDSYAQAIREAEKQRKADGALLARRAAANAAAARETAALRQKLQAALDANREWAAQPVPKEVRDALGQP